MIQGDPVLDDQVWYMSSSVEVIRTTDIGVCDRRAVYYPAGEWECILPRGRGRFSALAIQSILENGM